MSLFSAEFVAGPYDGASCFASCRLPDVLLVPVPAEIPGSVLLDASAAFEGQLHIDAASARAEYWRRVVPIMRSGLFDIEDRYFFVRMRSDCEARPGAVNGGRWARMLHALGRMSRGAKHWLLTPISLTICPAFGVARPNKRSETRPKSY